MVVTSINEVFALCYLSPRQQRGGTQIYSRRERSDLDTISDQVGLKYVRCKVIGDSRSMEDVTKWTKALDIGFSCMKVDPKWNQGDL